MTEYPVQCYNNNGEPYGRYCNPHKKNAIEWPYFEIYAEDNTFPMPLGTIGKTYERDEVEVVWQYYRSPVYYDPPHIDQLVDGNSDRNANINLSSRQIFRLLPQPVEKEPETLEQAAERCLSDMLSALGDIKCPDGLRKDFISMFIAGANWQIQQLK